MFQVMLSVKTRSEYNRLSERWIAESSNPTELSPTLILSPSASLVDQTDNPTIKGRFTDAPPELLSGLITDYEGIALAYWETRTAG